MYKIKKTGFRRKVYAGRRKKVTGKRKFIKKAITKAKHKIFAKSVLRIVKRSEETKHAQPVQNLRGTQIFAYNSVGGSAQPVANTSTFIELTSIFNTIGQGTGQGDRVGNRISPTKFSFTGWINYSQNYTQNNLPCYIKMVIMRMKNTVNAQYPNMQNFLQYGNTTQQPQNLLNDIRQLINKDDVIVYAQRTFKLGPAASSSALSNNDFKLCQSFNINLTKYIKTAIYDDQMANMKNHQMFAVFLGGTFSSEPLAPSEGTPVDYPLPANITYNIELSYKDD